MILINKLRAHTQDTTRRFVEIYHSLKEVALAGAQRRMDRFEQLFTKSLRLAGEGINFYLLVTNKTPPLNQSINQSLSCLLFAENPGVAREAIAIAIWYLRTNI